MCGSLGCTCSLLSWFSVKPIEQLQSADLANLKKELATLSARVDQRQKALRGPTQPKTAAEFDLLEKKLAEALAEVRNQRTALGQGEPEKK